MVFLQVGGDTSLSESQEKNHEAVHDDESKG